jgi:hypothetical protein
MSTPEACARCERRLPPIGSGAADVSIELDGYVIAVRIDRATATLDDGTIGAVHYGCLTDGERQVIEDDIRVQQRPTLEAIGNAGPY